MTERDVDPRLPTSGQIVGALVARLGIKHSELQKKTARRYFAADLEHLVKDASKEKVLGAIAEVLTDSDLVSSQSERDNTHSLESALASTLRWQAEHWDLLRSFIRRRTISVQPSHLPKIWEAYVRLAIIDLALRVSAHLHLAGSSPKVLDFLDWANQKARGDFLNKRRREASLTLEELADTVGVSDNTVDAWMYQGARPSNENLLNIAEALASASEASNAPDVALELRALYWVSDVATLLSEHIGGKATDEIIGRLHRYAEATYRTIDDQFPSENRAEDLTVLADLGRGASLAEPLVSALDDREEDDGWREDLRATGIDWIRRVLSVNLDVHFAEVDDLIQKTDGRLLDDWGVSDPEAYAHYQRSLGLRSQGRLEEALGEVETAARLDPTDPAYHFTLGSVKANLGIVRRDSVLTSEGLNALWLAVTLDPNWLLPWTEIGSTLHFAGKSAEAVEHLSKVSPRCGPLDSRYYGALGAAHWKIDELPKALEAFEASLELDPEETSDLLAASEIASLLGDRGKHRLYLQRAKHFGADEGTLEIWGLMRRIGQNDQTCVVPSPKSGPVLREQPTRIVSSSFTVKLNAAENAMIA